MSRLRLPFLILVTVASFVASYNTINLLYPATRVPLVHGLDGSEVDVTKLVEEAATQAGGSVGGALTAAVKRPADPAGKKRRLFHTVVTANDSPYTKWQCRVMYHWYKKYRDGEGSEMGGFTRVLHSGAPDNLMEEIPTFVVDPLPEGMDKGYVVLNRPWAFVQWVQKAVIEEEYVFMAEPDHIIVRPIPNLATQWAPAAFPFFYIDPEKNEDVLRRWFPESKGAISQIDPIGNSPVIIKKTDLMRIAPTWHNVSLQMKDDPAADKAFGWVLEMYGYATAAAMHGISHTLQKTFMIQPPWDPELRETYIIHYTYGCDFDLKGRRVDGKVGPWHFDKREFSGGAPPRNLTLPPKGSARSVFELIGKINDATWDIPDWTTGAT